MTDDRDVDDRRKQREMLIKVMEGLIQRRADYYEWRFKGYVDRQDLVSGALFALARAADLFIPERNTSWENYARQWVNGGMLRAVRTTQRRLRQERAMLLGSSHLQAAYRDNYNILEHDDDELSRRLDGFLESLALASTIAAYDEDANNLDVELEDRETLHEIRDAIAASLHLLPPKDRRMLWLIYHEGHDIEETAAVLGVSRSTAFRRHTRAIETMRRAMKKLNVRCPPRMKRWPLLDFGKLLEP